MISPAAVDPLAISLAASHRTSITKPITLETNHSYRLSCTDAESVHLLVSLRCSLIKRFYIRPGSTCVTSNERAEFQSVFSDGTGSSSEDA